MIHLNRIPFLINWINQVSLEKLEMRLLFILIYNVFCQEIAMVFSAAKVNRQDELVMGLILNGL